MGRLNVRKFSHSLNVRYITEADFPDIAALCAGNPLYYEKLGHPAPAAKDIRADIEALPPGKGKRDKYYLGIFGLDGRLDAVLDLIAGYPERDTAWIGFSWWTPRSRAEAWARGWYPSCWRRWRPTAFAAWRSAS